MATDRISRREAAEILDVHVDTVSKMIGEGLEVAVIERRGRGNALVLSRRAVLAFHGARRVPGDLDPKQERARRDRAQAVLSEQAFKQRARDLLPADEVERVWSGHISAVRTKILSWSAVLAGRIHRAARGGVGAVEAELDAAVREVLTELAAETSAGGPPARAPRRKPKKAPAIKKRAKKPAKKRPAKRGPRPKKRAKK